MKRRFLLFCITLKNVKGWIYLYVKYLNIDVDACVCVCVCVCVCARARKYYIASMKDEYR